MRLFSDAPASALIDSLVDPAKANGFEPYLWLRKVLRDSPTATIVEPFCGPRPAPWSASCLAPEYGAPQRHCGVRLPSA